jgi:hypothetical protein
MDLWVAFSAGSLVLPVQGTPCSVLGDGKVVALDRARPGGLLLDGSEDDAVGEVVSVLYSTRGACGSGPQQEVRLHLLGHLHPINASATLYLDEHRLDVTGVPDDSVIRVRAQPSGGLPGVAGPPWTSAECHLHGSGVSGPRTCSVPIDDDVVDAATAAGANLFGTQVQAWPEGLDDSAPVTPPLYADGGRRVQPGELSVPVTNVVVDAPLVQVGTVQLLKEQSRLPLRLPQVVATVFCPDAMCALDDGAIDVSQADPAVTQLTIDVRLRDGVSLAGPHGAPTSDAEITVPVARCDLRPLGALGLLAGADGERLFLSLGADCPATDLTGYRLSTSPPTDISLIGLHGNGPAANQDTPGAGAAGALLEARVDSVPMGIPALTVRLERVVPDHAVVGVAQVNITQAYVPESVSLSLDGLGPVSFIPTNRDAHVSMTFPTPAAAAALELQPEDGVYTVDHGADGSTTVRGVVASAGQVPLVLGYVSPDVTQAMGSREVLAVVETHVQLAVAEVHVPSPLIDNGHGKALVGVTCKGQDGRDASAPAGEALSVDWTDRDSCRLLIDRSAVPLEDGAQRIHIRAEVDHPDGSALSGTAIDEIVQVDPASQGVESISLPAGSEASEFDRLSVSVSDDYAGGFYLLPGSEMIGPSVDYAVVFGRDRFRLLATTSIPTALYRLSTGGYRGAVSFSAGAIMRLAPLSSEGDEFWTVGEFGILATGLTAAQTNLSFVTGVALAIPLVNKNKSNQFSLNFHAWLEYSPTATGSYMGSNGQTIHEHPFAFIIGPSISFGDVGTNF